MQTKNNNIFYHLVAFLTVAIWGTTFVSTKVLMLNGLSPAQIFTLRFSIAYVLMLAFNHRRLFADYGKMRLRWRCWALRAVRSISAARMRR